MHQIPKLQWFLSRLAVVSAQSIKARCWVENEDIVGAAPTGGAPTTSEWSTILLPTKVRLLLEVWSWYWVHCTLRSRQNGSHYGDDILKWIFLYETYHIVIQISLKFVPKGPITGNNNQFISLGNSLVLNKQWAIIWTNDGLVYWHLSICLNELSLLPFTQRLVTRDLFY